MLYLFITLVPKLFELYSLLIFISCLLSWFPGAYQTPFGQWMLRFTEPYLSKFRKLPLQFAGMDFSAWVALIVLQLAERGYFILLGVIL